MEVLKRTKLHPTADWIYDRVREKCPNVSLGTIYRNLNMLKEKGLIRELKYGKNTARYDGNFESHHHIFCFECGKLEDVQYRVHPGLNKSVEKTSGYKIINHQLEFNGICPECSKKKKIEKQWLIKNVNSYTNVIDNQVIIGFDQQKIDEALAKQ